MENKELNLDEMEKIGGGNDESETGARPLQIPEENPLDLGSAGQAPGIKARNNGTTLDQIMKVNKELKNPDFIRS